MKPLVLQDRSDLDNDTLPRPSNCIIDIIAHKLHGDSISQLGLMSDQYVNDHLLDVGHILTPNSSRRRSRS